MESTEPSRTITPSATSARAPVAARIARGDALLAASEQVERRLNRIPHRPLGGRVDVVAVLEGRIDGLREIRVRHIHLPVGALSGDGKGMSSKAGGAPPRGLWHHVRGAALCLISRSAMSPLKRKGTADAAVRSLLYR